MAPDRGATPEMVSWRREGATSASFASVKSASGGWEGCCGWRRGRITDVSVLRRLVLTSSDWREGGHRSRTDVSIGSACLQVSFCTEGRMVVPVRCADNAWMSLSSLAAHVTISISRTYEAKTRKRFHRPLSLLTRLLTKSWGSTNWPGDVRNVL